MIKTKRPMRHRLFSLMAGSFAATILFSCSVPMPDEMQAGDRPVFQSSVVEAGFESGATRTSLSPNDAGNLVCVNWTPGDSFLMMRGYQSTLYTTTDSGPRAQFTSQTTLSGNDICCCFYPQNRFVTWGNYRVDNTTTELAYVMALPSSQTAVPGGVQEGLNLSVATAAKPGDDLTFRNLVSYIRFRLGGAAASQVTSVIFDPGVSIAGDFTIFGMASGNLRTSFDLRWNHTMEPEASAVQLNGTFTPGQDYYLAVMPTQVTGFSMFFKDAEGRTIRKYSSLTLDMQRSTVYDFGTIPVGASFAEEANYTESCHLYKAAGASIQHPIDICVLPDGFRASELSNYVGRAHSAIDFLFETEPYKTYKDYFNAYVMEVPSEESGGGVTDGNGNLLTPHDNYFGTKWGADLFDDMMAASDRVWSFVSRNCPSIVNGTRTIQETMILILINDNRYGGRCFSVSDGCNYAMVPHNADMTSDWSYSTSGFVPNGNDGPGDGAHQLSEADYADIGHSSGNWRNTAIHEFGGHAIGRLCDEYWGRGYSSTPTERSTQHWQVPFGMNITHLKDNPFWKEDLLDRKAALVESNPDYDRIGVWQGGDNSLYNKWRSEKVSCMIDNRCYFSTWQRILIVKRIKALAGETFSLTDFFDHDVTTDPVRATLSRPSGAPMKAPADIERREPLPEPVLSDKPVRVKLEYR